VLQAHQQRVVDELTSLYEKLDKLDAFIGTDVFNKLHKAEQRRLSRQSMLMSLYVDVLCERVQAFPESNGTNVNPEYLKKLIRR
jgi:hypothetical protein